MIKTTFALNTSNSPGDRGKGFSLDFSCFAANPGFLGEIAAFEKILGLAMHSELLAGLLSEENLERMKN